MGDTGHGHYFDASPATASAPRRVTLTLPDLRLELATDRGVFATTGVDPGTKYLLLDGPGLPADARRLLDLGCGYGPIAVTLARRAPRSVVWAVDVNERAVALCRENATAAGADNVRALVVTPAEPTAGVPDDVSFDAIWSNPPVRIGKEALHRLLATWLPRLCPGGRAVLVVHKHLGADSLARWLDDEGYPTRRLGSRAGYRLLEVQPHTEPPCAT